MTEANVFSVRVEDVPDPELPGSIKAPCIECGKEVWLSTYSQSLLAEAKALGIDLGVACLPCLPALEARDSEENPDEEPGQQVHLEKDGFLEAILRQREQRKRAGERH